MTNDGEYFCSIYQYDRVILFFQPVDVMQDIDFQMLSQLGITGIHPSLSWCIILFKYCGIQFANILLRVFPSMFVRDTVLQFFSVISLSSFGIGVMLIS